MTTTANSWTIRPLAALALAAGITALPLISGCGKQPSEPPETGEIPRMGRAVDLDFYIWAEEESYMQPVVNAYNALQHSAKITLHILEDYDEAMLGLLAEEAEVDLLALRGFTILADYAESGELLDLTRYIRDSDMDVMAYGTMFNDAAIRDRYYAVPTRSTTWFLLYNKDLFDEAGMPYPRQMTWDEYRDLAIRLSRDDGDKRIYGGYWVPWCFDFGAIQRSSYLIDDDLTYARESLKMLNDYYNLDGSHIPYSEMNTGVPTVQTFQERNIAMMPQGEWMINMLLQAEGEGYLTVDWDIAPMPVFEGQEAGVTWGQYQFAAVSADSPHPDEAFDFIRFLCGEQGARILAGNGIIHAYSDEEVQRIYLEAVGKDSASILFDTRRVQEHLAVKGYPDLRAAFEACADEYLSGGISLDEAMNSFEEARRDIFGK